MAKPMIPEDGLSLFKADPNVSLKNQFAIKSAFKNAELFLIKPYVPDIHL